MFTGRGTNTIALEEVLPLGRWLMVMMAVWGMMDTINIVLSGALKGAGDTRFVMYYSVCMAWFVWILGEGLILFVFRGGVMAAWIWMTVYVFLLAAGFLWRYRTGRWKTIEMLEPGTPTEPHRPGAEALAIVDG